jgi:hypothetical protein
MYVSAREHHVRCAETCVRSCHLVISCFPTAVSACHQCLTTLGTVKSWLLHGEVSIHTHSLKDKLASAWGWLDAHPQACSPACQEPRAAAATASPSGLPHHPRLFWQPPAHLCWRPCLRWRSSSPARPGPPDPPPPLPALLHRPSL